MSDPSHSWQLTLFFTTSELCKQSRIGGASPPFTYPSPILNFLPGSPPVLGSQQEGGSSVPFQKQIADDIIRSRCWSVEKKGHCLISPLVCPFHGLPGSCLSAHSRIFTSENSKCGVHLLWEHRKDLCSSTQYSWCFDLLAHT